MSPGSIISGEKMSKVDRLALSVILLFALASPTLAHTQSYRCKRVPLATETRWGGNERIEIDLRDKPVQKVRGTVLGPGEGTESTLVQVYLRQPSDSLYRPPDQESRLPIAACVTGNDGSFGFSLPPGEYELRMSQNQGIDVTSVFVTVGHGHYSLEKISVEMHVGT